LVNKTTGIYAVQSPSNLTVQYCYIHDLFGVPFHLIGTTNTLVEYSMIFRNKSTADWHTEGMQCRGCVGLTSRYNIWKDIQGTSVIVSGSGNSSNWYIYGNVFLHGLVGLGPVSDNQFDSIHDVYIYNNTIVGFPAGSNAGMNFYNGTGN